MNVTESCSGAVGMVVSGSQCAGVRTASANVAINSKERPKQVAPLIAIPELDASRYGKHNRAKQGCRAIHTPAPTCWRARCYNGDISYLAHLRCCKPQHSCSHQSRTW